MKSLALTFVTGIIFIPRVTFTRNALSDIAKERKRTGRKKTQYLTLQRRVNFVAYAK